MSAQILDGKALGAKIKEEIKQTIINNDQLQTNPPCMALILVGEDPGSKSYVRLKAKACKAVGIINREFVLPDTISETELLKIITDLNDDKSVDAILVQLPLPGHINTNRILAAIDQKKDVDGFNPINVGLLHSGQNGLVPCTPRGIMALFQEYNIKLDGRKALVIGRSNIVGAPMARLLQDANCTVTVAHTHSQNLSQLVSEADILVSAAGSAGLINGDMLKPGCVVIDVGQNHSAEGNLVGDVDFQSASQIASYITPVPGGVGPLTIAFLLKNCLDIALSRIV